VGENRDVGALEPLIGEWAVEMELPGAGPMRGTTSFAWLFGRSFVVQEASAEHPDAPRGHMILAPDPARPGGFLQHYFDSRGVVRLYAMTFDGHTWTLERSRPDFSPLEFQQRWTATLDADGDVISGQWERTDGGGAWLLDFRLTYRRRR
jgi:hypothetical protein